MSGVGDGGDGGFPAHPAESQVKSFGFQSQLKDEEINPQANKSSWARQRPTENTRGRWKVSPDPWAAEQRYWQGVSKERGLV